jgi:hypothetical protein
MSAIDLRHFRCAPMSRFGLGGGNELISLSLSGHVYVVSRQDADLLGRCALFRSIDEHAATAGGLNDPTPIRLRLSELASLGLLVSPDEIVGTASAIPAGPDPPRVSQIAIPTCSRPQDLVRALKSYAENVARWGHDVLFFVADDSSSPTNVAASREAARLSGARIRYAGPVEKEDFVRRLALACDSSPKLLRFALSNDGVPVAAYGANRNAILLRTAGQRAISVDDDTVCRLTSVKTQSGPPYLRLGNDLECIQSWFLPDANAARDIAEQCDADFIAGHENLLGWPLSDVLRRAAGKGSIDLTAACDHLLVSAASGSGTVRITVSGFCGDSGGESTYSRLLIEEPNTRERLTCSPQGFQTAVTSREMISQVPGIPNRRYLPRELQSFLLVVVHTHSLSAAAR